MSSRARLFTIVGAIAALILFVWALFLVPRNDTTTSADAPDEVGSDEATERPTTPPEELPQPAVGDPADAAASVAGALAAVDGFLTTSQQLLAAPDGSLDAVAVFATGSALGAIRAQADEFLDLDARIEGQSKVVNSSADESALAADPPTVTVSVCLDDSGVVVFTPENPDGVASTNRTLTRYTVVYDGQTWKVTQTSYPDDPDC